MAYVAGVLPTLLSSRPVVSDEAIKRRSRPTPAALEVPEEPMLVTAPGLDSPPGLRIKNTFIEDVALLSPSLETFYQERAVHTCPSKHVGRCLSLLEELEREMPSTPVRTPLNIQTPGSIRTPLGESLAQGLAGYNLCESPCAYPCYAPQGQAAVFNALLVNATQVAAAPQSLSPQPASQCSTGTVRTVLSLAEALDQESAEQSQFPMFDFHDGQVVCLTQSGCLEAQVSVLDSLPQYAAPALDETTDIGKPPCGPALGAPELPSAGSIGHATGHCKPCAFVHSKGCENGLACQFCHLCGPDARKARRQDRLQQRRENVRARREKQAMRQCQSI